jgi:hypothetical protein
MVVGSEDAGDTYGWGFSGSLPPLPHMLGADSNSDFGNRMPGDLASVSASLGSEIPIVDAILVDGPHVPHPLGASTTDGDEAMSDQMEGLDPSPSAGVD